MREFDDLLEEVLKDRVAEEPRVGMERRILARIREDGERGFDWRRMGWIAAASLAACLAVVAVVQLGLSRTDNNAVSPPRAASVPSTAARTNSTGEMPGPSPGMTSHLDRHADRRVASVREKAVRPGDSQAEAERLPKLDIFPAVTQKGELVTAPAVAQAIQELKAEQDGPIVIAAIDIKPLEQETR